MLKGLHINVEGLVVGREPTPQGNHGFGTETGRCVAFIWYCCKTNKRLLSASGVVSVLRTQ
jgi:hypothetical protein